jgi:hypothetical protein
LLLLLLPPLLLASCSAFLGMRPAPSELPAAWDLYLLLLPLLLLASLAVAWLVLLRAANLDLEINARLALAWGLLCWLTGEPAADAGAALASSCPLVRPGVWSAPRPAVVSALLLLLLLAPPVCVVGDAGKRARCTDLSTSVLLLVSAVLHAEAVTGALVDWPTLPCTCCVADSAERSGPLPAAAGVAAAPG